MDNSEMKKVYDQYYKCGAKSCDSHYHTSMLDKPELLCKDCNNVSKVPREAQIKARPKGEQGGRRK